MSRSEDEKAPIRDPEGFAAHQAPAILVNRAYIYFDGIAVRIVFADQGAPDWSATVRTSILMYPPTAIEFAKVLRNTLAGVEGAIEQAKVAAAEKKDG
jgi:hypothetical protein